MLSHSVFSGLEISLEEEEIDWEEAIKSKVVPHLPKVRTMIISELGSLLGSDSIELSSISVSYEGSEIRVAFPPQLARIHEAAEENTLTAAQVSGIAPIVIVGGRVGSNLEEAQVEENRTGLEHFFDSLPDKVWGLLLSY